jgi:hypothetical protein
MTLQLLHDELPYTVFEENLIFFFISVGGDVNQSAPIHRRLLDSFKDDGRTFPSTSDNWSLVSAQCHVLRRNYNGPDYKNLM